MAVLDNIFRQAYSCSHRSGRSTSSSTPAVPRIPWAQLKTIRRRDSMNQEFNAGRNVYIDEDTSGVPRQLLHFHAPVFISAATPQLVAHTYLNQYADLLGLPHDQLNNLGLTPSE